MKVVIGTPYYEVKAFAPYIISLINSEKILNELEIEWDYYEVSGDSYVQRAKNSLVHRFLKSDATHLFMIDSDVAWNVDGFARIIRAGLAGFEFVGAAYPMKNNWVDFASIPHKNADGFCMGKEIGEMRLIAMERIPGGFTLIAREAFERTRPNLDYYHGKDDDEIILEVFKLENYFELQPKSDDELKGMSKDELIDWAKKHQRGERVGHLVGEDIYFQHRYKEMGGVIWLEPNVTINHYGIKGWEGNYHEHLLREHHAGLVEELEQSPHKANIKSVQELKGKHKGETAYIVATGPSLDKLTAEHIGDGPVIPIYQALKKVRSLNLPNPIYSFQKDRGEIEVVPGETLVTHYHESYGFQYEHEEQYVFDNPKDFGLPIMVPSVPTAVDFAAYMGCDKVVMVSCDSCVTGDARNWIGDDAFITREYCERHKDICETIHWRIEAKDLTDSWICPE